MWPPHLLFRRAEEIGVPTSDLESIRVTLKSLAKEGVAPILSLRHLCLMTGASYHFLRHTIGRSGTFSPYRNYYVAKRAGGKRMLSEPHSMLRHVQRWLVDNVLNKMAPHSASYAFAPNSSIVACAAAHCGANWLIKVDITSFFESISEVQVFDVFSSIGFPPLVAFELSRICTFPFNGEHARYRNPRWRNPRLHEASLIAAYADDRMGHLPQGAPTSPMLANLVCRNLDSDIAELCNKAGWSYTRYADDITCSTVVGDRQSSQSLLQRITRILQQHNLKPNCKKTAIVAPGARKLVLGLLVDGERPRLTQTYRRSMEAHLYFSLKWGLAEHARKRKFDSALSLLEHLQGRVAFARQIDDKDAPTWDQQLKEVRKSFFQTLMESHS